MRRLRAGLFTYALAYTVLLTFMVATAVIYWPWFEQNIQAVRDFTAPIPVLRTMVGDLEEAGFVGYVVGQHFFKGCSTLGTAAAVLFAAGAVAGEAHRGTLEIWIGRPFSRLRILSQRYAAGALGSVVPVFASTLTIPWFAAHVDEEIALVPLLWCAAHQSLFLLAIYSLTFLLSALGTNPTRIALSVLFFTTLEFALYMVGNVTHYSLFRLSDIDEYMRAYDHSRLDAHVALPLALASMLTFAGAWLAFRRRVP